MMNSSPEQEEYGKGVTKSDDQTRSDRKVAVVGDRIDSRDLFSGAREIIIGHGNEAYRLRLTAQNKLILTK
jgi:hemin uptake protein HemP